MFVSYSSVLLLIIVYFYYQSFFSAARNQKKMIETRSNNIFSADGIVYFNKILNQNPFITQENFI